MESEGLVKNDEKVWFLCTADIPIYSEYQRLGNTAWTNDNNPLTMDNTCRILSADQEGILLHGPGL